MPTAAALALTSVLLATAAAPVAAPAQPPPGPVCQSARPGAFPVTARAQDAPRTYRAGARPRAWALALHNESGAPCAALHPVLVLWGATGKAGGSGRPLLRAADVRLEFRYGGRWRKADMEESAHHQVLAVLADFPGVRVAGHGTEALPVRVSFAPRIREPLRVTALAAVVQRKDGDGDWVGESPAYTFEVTARAGGHAEPEGTRAPAPQTGREPGRAWPPDSDTDPGDTDPGDTDPGGTDPGGTGQGDTDPGDTGQGDTGQGDTDPGRHTTAPRPPADEDPGTATGDGRTDQGTTPGDQSTQRPGLAATGAVPLRGAAGRATLAGTSLALLLTGGGLLWWGRRLRAGRS